MSLIGLLASCIVAQRHTSLGAQAPLKLRGLMANCGHQEQHERVVISIVSPTFWSLQAVVLGRVA